MCLSSIARSLEMSLSSIARSGEMCLSSIARSLEMCLSSIAQSPGNVPVLDRAVSGNVPVLDRALSGNVPVLDRAGQRNVPVLDRAVCGKCACPRSRVLREMCLSSIARSLEMCLSSIAPCPQSRRSTKCAWPLRSRRSIGGAREFWIGIEDGCARVVAGSANAVRRLANAIRPQASAAAGSARRSVRRGPRGCGCWIHNHDSARVCRAPSRARRERVDTRGSGT